MSLRARVILVCFVVCNFCSLLITHTAAAAERCELPAGKIVSVQGDVGVQAAGASSWLAAGLDHTLCPGDTLRVGAKSRAAVVLANESVLRIGENSALSFAEPTPEKVSLLNLLQGILHIFSHRPHSLNIATPFVSGAVEGTEFLVRVMPDRAVITVFEGRVMTANTQGELAVSSGQSIVAAAGQAPRYETVVRPRDAVQWTLYYPPIIDRDTARDGSPDGSPLSAAVEAVAVGGVDEAHRLIAVVLEKDANNAEALALLSIIELTRNNSEEAGRLAAQASATDPTSVAAAMATAYVRQATFDIPGALATLEQARQANPESAELLARLAELQLSVGELDQAEASATQAAALNPEIGRIQAVLGFAYLTRIETDKAKEAFNRAIALDPAMPLARLGLGLALIREGELEEGRAEIEIAAALDPGNALIRSYLGKAYYEEKRDGGAARQYEIAKELDPADPTPWFYDALRKQSVNRPVEALHDLQKSIELNDNRAVYRSRLLLDEDLAVRGASLGRIYSDLGFQQLALVEGWKSVNADPANYSAHRFLADSYSALPRHEIARVSELLQSQLLQPLNITPVQPQLAESNLFILDGAGPSEASMNEYSPLFLRNRLALQASGVAGSNDTYGDEVVQSGVWNRFSYSLGQFHYQTDGFRENNDQNQDIQNAYAQYSLSNNTSILAEIRNTDRETGDLELLFDPDWYSSDLRQKKNGKIGRFGFCHSFSPYSEVLGVVTSEDLEEEFKQQFQNGTVRLSEENDGYLAETQLKLRTTLLNILSGVGLHNGDTLQVIEMIFDPNMPSYSSPVEPTDLSHFNGYLYSQVEYFKNSIMTIGLSYDQFDDDETSKDQFNPKIGIVWNPSTQTTFRAAAFRVFTRILVADQTIEPTQVAGFNQFYDDAAKVGSWIYGGAVDQTFTKNIFGGIEITARRQDVPDEIWNHQDLTDSQEFREVEWQENLARVYLYWTPSSWLSTSAEYFFEDFDRGDQFVGTENFQDLKTQRIRLGCGIFQNSGLFLRFYATFADQRGDFYEPVSTEFIQDNDQFWVIDGGIGYRLPNRHGIVSFEARNLFDQDFRYQDTDPGNPHISPSQLVLLKVTLYF